MSSGVVSLRNCLACLFLFGAKIDTRNSLFCLASCKEIKNLPRNDYKMDNVVGGKDCNVSEWAFFVQLRTELVHICGATLLNEYWILTAAHCFAFSNFTTPEFFAISGLTSVDNVNTDAAQISRLHKSYLHPLYDYKDIFSRHDVAIAKVERPMKETEFVKFVTLAQQSESLTSLCSVGRVAGFGEQNIKIFMGGTDFYVIKNAYKPHLQCLNLIIPPTKDCLKYASLVQYPTSFCALSRGPGQDTCQGDSGGPFMCGDVQVGITSRGIGCGMVGVAGAYTRVEFYYHFIKYTSLQEDERSGQNVPSGNNHIIFVLFVNLLTIVEFTEDL